MKRNIILIGMPGQEKMEVVWNLCKKIRDKTAPPEIIGKKPLLFLTLTGADLELRARGHT